jgi:hypothetical protein
MNNRLINATPEKRVYLSIITEYDLKRSICELIDNAIDLWSKNKRADVEITIVADEQQRSISIEDNAGGIEESKLDHVVSPGKTSNDIHDDLIGYFGVGSKRAVVALAQDIAIHSRFEHEKPFVVKFDEDWIENDDSWYLPYAESTRLLRPYSTLIELNRLRIHLTLESISELKVHLGEVYAKFIDRGAVIRVNGDLLTGTGFDDDWSYPPELFPTRLHTRIPREDRLVDVEITSGLIDHPGDPDNSYGVFVYCNNRLVGRALTDFSVGFTSGAIGNPHYNISLARTVVKIKGQSGDMPWDSSKSGINTKHEVFQAIRPHIVEMTRTYAKVSRSLQGKWESEVFPHTTGRIIEKDIDSAASIPKSYLPKPPPSKPRLPQRLLAANSDILEKKPWSTGLLESVIALEAITKLPLSQKNRIGLIVLDSTVEIAYKEYLVNEVGIGMGSFKKIAGTRGSVQEEVLKHLDVPAETVKKIEYYYKHRNDLIHQRATPNVSDEQISSYRTIVEELLHNMFGLNFLSQ